MKGPAENGPVFANNLNWCVQARTPRFLHPMFDKWKGSR